MNSKGKGILSYLLGWIGGLIVIFGFKDNDRKTVTHAYQAIVISVSVVVLNIASGFVDGIISAFTGLGIPLMSGAVSILSLVLMILGIVKVCNDDPDPKLPVIGDLTMSIFGKNINQTPENVATAGTVPRFDPNTGQPINAQPQGNFDPNTGQPINPQPQANFNPATGQPVNQQPQANFDPTTGQPITTPSTTPTDQNTI